MDIAPLRDFFSNQNIFSIYTLKERKLSDIELVKAVQQGEINAFEKIVNRHQKNIERTIIGILGNSSEAEDVGQEVFIRFYRSINKYRGDSSVGTYLTRIAINLSLFRLSAG